MAKEICISSTPHETRLAILEDDQLTEIYYERENEYTLAGSIYKGRVTRVLPGMQSAFVDVGLERDAFLYVTDFLEEAGESADFERVATPAARTENKSREPRESRQRPQPKVEYTSESNLHATDQNGVELSVAPPAPEEGREEESDGGGTKRWRGRRGRRRSGGGRSGSAAAKPAGENGQPAPAMESSEAPFESVESIDMLPYDDTEPFSSPFPVPSIDGSGDASGDASGTGTGEASGTVEPEARSSSRGSRRESGRRPGHDSAPTISLPGESLSKYGAKPAESATVTVAVAAPKPSQSTFKPKTLVDAPVLLDGGLLAGESLSKRRRSPSAESVAPAIHESEPVHEVSPSAHQEHVPVAAADTAAIGVGESLADAHNSGLHEMPPFAEESSELVEEEETELQELHAVAAHDSLSLEEAFEAEPGETELTDASASHKVDPSAPSEFRLPWFSDKSKAKEAAEPATSTAVEDGEQDLRPEEHEPQGGIQSGIDQHHAEHRAQAAVAGSSVESGADSGIDSVRGFAPGSGLLEEEIIDEEEYDFAPLHAHSDEHDHDELEEETLDQQMGGAELGEMVREAALNQRISGESADEEADEEVEEESAADLAEAEAYGDEIAEDAPAVEGAPAPSRRPDDNRRGGRQRQGRRGGRTGSGSSGGRGGRQNTQPSDLPIISDLLKQGQEILVQIAKEPIAKKGARITSHIALPGRFLVFMPTVNHVGVSRKISSDEERQRLKRILISEKGDAVGGFIVRTAAATASEEDLRADIRFLLSLWTGIKERSDTAKAPALIYHDLNLVERVLRDQVSDNFSSIWVDNEVEYERIVRFLQRFQPSLVRRVKLYTKETPLFEQFGIQDEITKALKSKVWLKSGGSIVINQTEALVAIDINTGKYVGKTARLEDTILRTNLDAIPEIVRQIRLRDLGGIIVIDFIDMDERKNRHRVMMALEEALKSDRAPSKVLQFNDFGLVAITRKRVKQSLERTLSVQCEVCTGTGMVKSPTTVCNEIYIEMRKMHRTFETPDVLLRVHPEVVKSLKGSGARWLTEMEEMISKNIIVKSDPALHPEQFDIH